MALFENMFRKKDNAKSPYTKFWQWFQSNEKAFFKVLKTESDIEKNFFDKLSVKLNEIRSGFFYLTGMMNENTAELVLTAEGNIKNIPFVEELVDAAPEITGWKFTALKPALDIKDVNIEMAGHKFSRANLYFYANDVEGCPDEIDITIVHDEMTSEDDDVEIKNGIYIFLDNYLGELESVTTIDNLSFATRQTAKKELIPIEKLKSFLQWKEKEFVEKYEGLRVNTENDAYMSFEAQLQSGNALVAIMNSNLLNWDSKASHPWFVRVEIPYDGEGSNGMPDKKTYALLNEIEDKINDQLRDFDGYLNIGRETGDNTRTTYFACKEFRKPSKVMDEVQKHFSLKVKISFEIYKDKYWQTLRRFSTY